METLLSSATSSTRAGLPGSTRAPTSCSGHKVNSMSILKAWLLRTGLNSPNLSSSQHLTGNSHLPPQWSRPAMLWTTSAERCLRHDHSSVATWAPRWAMKTFAPSGCAKAPRTWGTSLSATGPISAPVIRKGHCRTRADFNFRFYLSIYVFIEIFVFEIIFLLVELFFLIHSD